MAYEIIENDRTVQVFGNCFIDKLTTVKEITVDGDLVADVVRTPRIVVTNGSLVCPRVEADSIHADILGFYQLAHSFRAPDTTTYHWLRPMKNRPDERAWTSTDTIKNVVDTLSWPELVEADRVPESVRVALGKVIARPSCPRAFVLFQLAIEELSDAKAWTTLGTQVARCFHDNDLPRCWRW